MNIIKDMIGDYIYINFQMYPTTAIYYRNKKILKDEELEDVIEYIDDVFKKLSIDKDENYKFVVENISKITDIVLTEKGLIRYSFSL